MTSLVHGRTAIVTGGASGIGRSCAAALAREGARVIVADLAAQRPDDVATQLEQSVQGGHLGVAVDVGDEDQVRGLSERVDAAGGADILVNAAGAMPRARVEEMSLEEWERVFSVNVTGPFLTCRAALPGMIGRGWGRIVNVSSSRALYGHPRASHYAASKAALVAFTRSLAREVTGTGVTANTLMPGQTDTPIWRRHQDEAEIGRQLESGVVGRPEELDGILLFLASDLSAELTGAVINREIRPGGKGD